MSDRIVTVIAEAIDSTSDAISIGNPHTPDHDSPSQQDFRRIKHAIKERDFDGVRSGQNSGSGPSQNTVIEKRVVSDRLHYWKNIQKTSILGKK
jgi:hypothetical protein